MTTTTQRKIPADLKPADGRFGCGPSKVRPDALARLAAQYGEEDLIVGRNTFFGDGLETVDLGIYKSFRFSWQHDLNVRFEAYNVLNKVQYGFPTADLNSPTFGQIVGGAVTYAPRTFQIALRYRY